MLHPIPNGGSGPSCFVSASSHRHGSPMSCSASFHPWKSCHVTTGSHDSTYVTPWPLWQGLVVVVVVPSYVTSFSTREGTGIGCLIVDLCCFTTNAVDWVVRCSNHRAVPSSATTGPDLPVPAPRHGSPPAVPRLAPFGTAPCTVPRPKGPVYRLRGRWPFNVVPQDKVQFNVMPDVSSLTSWGTFRAARSVPGRDVLIAVVLAFCARESRKLVRDVVHHGQTSAGRTHRYSVSS
jgi:hypothetical protein